MGAAFFYHLTHAPMEQTLAMLLNKSRGAGWNVLVRGANDARLKSLDHALWQGPQDEFLPHGIAGGDHDADQPILLTLSGENPNDAKCLIAVDGADVAPEEVENFARVCVLFDGNDGAALSRARAQWKSLVDGGCSAQYWSQESGNWEKKAERPAPE